MIIEYTTKGFSLSNPNFKKLTGYLIANLTKDPHCPTKLCFNLGQVLLEKDQPSIKTKMNKEIHNTQYDLNKLYFLGPNYFEDMIAIEKLTGNVIEFSNNGSNIMVADSLYDYGDRLLRDLPKSIDKTKVSNARMFLNKLHLFI